MDFLRPLDFLGLSPCLPNPTLVAGELPGLGIPEFSEKSWFYGTFPGSGGHGPRALGPEPSSVPALPLLGAGAPAPRVPWS